ncbi:hypothetical protein IQ07DRAFT_584101 [Pyrenochaeta sp. DS3sAY3a]|nr:hypothetical protein IQ07DRAFT_584101 [Pyrenochaeta sp. DS3sAY3a]
MRNLARCTPSELHVVGRAIASLRSLFFSALQLDPSTCPSGTIETACIAAHPHPPRLCVRAALPPASVVVHQHCNLRPQSPHGAD